MNSENRWVKGVAMIPWETIEEKYAELLPSDIGMSVKPLRMVLGSIMMQKQYGYYTVNGSVAIRKEP